MSYQIAMIGLGVMGKSLALNLVDHGFSVVGFDLSQSHCLRANNEAQALALEPNKGQFKVAEGLKDLISSLTTPRVIALSVPAGDIVDQVIEQLLQNGLESQDIVIDTGNSLWTDSERRENSYAGRLRFFSTAVSGGEQGARHGPSLMASGDPIAWQHVEPLWTAISAKVDANGLSIDSHQSGEPCAAYLGPAGAGHYVKMVHNGIEYADMQIICEAYQFMREALNMSAAEISNVFSAWNEGVLNSYLMEISADILKQQDPKSTNALVDMILDVAEQKGTGLWTAVNALQVGSPATTIAQAVFARALSAKKACRVKASSLLPSGKKACSEDKKQSLEALEDGVYCAKLVTYAQGFDLMKSKSEIEGWQLNFSDIAKIWRSGCIIRAAFLQNISAAYQQNSSLEHLLFAPDFIEQLSARVLGWRTSSAQAILSGVAMPAITSALNYYDSLSSSQSPANLLQAQRDYFGAHTYARIDEPSSDKFHLLWETETRSEIKR